MNTPDESFNNNPCWMIPDITHSILSFVSEDTYTTLRLVSEEFKVLVDLVFPSSSSSRVSQRVEFLKKCGKNCGWKLLNRKDFEPWLDAMAKVLPFSTEITGLQVKEFCELYWPKDVSKKAVREMLLAAAGCGNKDICEMMIAKGADERAMEDAYCFACGNDHVEVCKLFLAKGVDVNAMWGGEEFPCGRALHYATENGNFEICKLLIENGVDVNSIFQGSDALSMAAAGCHIEICKLLLENGASVDNVDEGVIDDATRKYLLEIAESLRGNSEVEGLSIQTNEPSEELHKESWHLGKRKRDQDVQ